MSARTEQVNTSATLGTSMANKNSFGNISHTNYSTIQYSKTICLTDHPTMDGGAVPHMEPEK